MADVMAKTAKGFGAGRANYAAELVAERLTGARSEGFTNAAMAWGTEHEAEARDAYAFRVDADVLECGFVDHPTIGMTGASPDGLVGDDGLIEIKCPGTAAHISSLRYLPIASKYVLQMQWQMACTDRAWCDFVSYDPRLPERMRLHIRRVKRDDKLIAELGNEVAIFLGDVSRTIRELRDLYDEDVEPQSIIAAG